MNHDTCIENAELLNRRANRERAARKEAERILEAKSRDLFLANQALSVEYLAKEGRTLGNQVFRVPQELDARVAELKLAAMGITIDTLTEEQQKYMTSWQEGT